MTALTSSLLSALSRAPRITAVAARSWSSAYVIMDFEKVKNGLSSNSIILLDVRGRDENAKERIPGAKNIPNTELAEGMALSDDDFAKKFGFSKPSKSDPLVTHCMKGGRAGKAAEALQQLGYNNVQVYMGSFNDWKANGGPTES